MLKRTVTASIIAFAMPFSAAIAQDAGTVVAKVGDDDITLGEMLTLRQTMQMQGELPPADAATWDLILNQLIRQTAVAATDTDLSPLEQSQLELQRRSYLATNVLEKVAEPEPSEDEIKAEYDSIFAEAEPATEYSAAHILVKTEEEAKAIKVELDGGADFGTLAEERSTGPSGPNKGDLGWFEADRMVPPFAEAVKAMEKGQISDPVQTDFGWHVIMLNDTREVQPPALDEVREQLVMQIRRDRVEAAIEQMVGDARVEKTEGLDPSLLNDAALLDGQ